MEKKGEGDICRLAKKKKKKQVSITNTKQMRLGRKLILSFAIKMTTHTIKYMST